MTLGKLGRALTVRDGHCTGTLSSLTIFCRIFFIIIVGALLPLMQRVLISAPGSAR